MVGKYADSSGVTHGLFFVPPNGFFTFDFPGSTFTSLNGINAKGVICGRYVDASGTHGFLARVTGTPPTTPAGTEMKANVSPSLVTPLDPSPSAWGGAMPARRVEHRGPLASRMALIRSSERSAVRCRNAGQSQCRGHFRGENHSFVAGHRRESRRCLSSGSDFQEYRLCPSAKRRRVQPPMGTRILPWLGRERSRVRASRASRMLSSRG